MPVIQKSQIMPLVLAKCPGFMPLWEKHREFWEGEDAGIYNDMAEFAHYVVDAYERGDREPVAAAFGLIEELLTDGDQEVRDAAGIGFLEDVRNTASWRPFGSAVFVEWLGPQSRLAWAEIEEMWRGKKSLADVVRAERSGKKARTRRGGSR